MHIKKCRRRGHIYYVIVQTMRREDKIVQKSLLNLGRLDNLTNSRRLELDQKISVLGGSSLLQKFHNLLYSIGYLFPSPVVTITDHDVLQYLKEKYPDVYKRVFAKSGGFNEHTIKTLIDTLDRGSREK